LKAEKLESQKRLVGVVRRSAVTPQVVSLFTHKQSTILLNNSP